jgi:hypothetical protein
MTRYNIALATAVAVAAMSSFNQPAAAAIEYPWCVSYGDMDGGGGKNCGFVSYEQCMMTARGAGGACEPNLFYLDQQAKQPRQSRQRPRND